MLTLRQGPTVCVLNSQGCGRNMIGSVKKEFEEETCGWASENWQIM